MADNNFATLVSKDGSLNAVTNPIYTILSDGSAVLDDGSGNIKVVVNNAAGASAVNIQDGGNSITVDGTVAATQSGTWVLGANSGVDIGDVTINNAAGAAAVNIQDGGNTITVDGTVAATQSGTWDIGTLTSITNDVNIADGGNSITVDAIDLDIRNLNLTDDAVKVSANSTANGPANPIYVSFTSAAVSGEVHDYDTATVAGSATDNHDYTVTTAMLVKSIIVSSSGALKAELQTGPVAGLISKAVLFIPKLGGSQQVDFDPPIEVPVTSTGTVRIIRTNREGSSNDVYSTIIGLDA